MIAHIILFAPRSDLSPGQREEILTAFTQAAAAAPTVRHVRIGRRILHGVPGYQQLMRTDFEYAAIVEFDDVAGLEEYLRHPAHAAAGRHFTESAAASLAYDYALVPAGEAAPLASKND
jgi:Stress responsive A/B Barrel Domain